MKDFLLKQIHIEVTDLILATSAAIVGGIGAVMAYKAGKKDGKKEFVDSFKDVAIEVLSKPKKEQ